MNLCAGGSGLFPDKHSAFETRGKFEGTLEKIGKDVNFCRNSGAVNVSANLGDMVFY